MSLSAWIMLAAHLVLFFIVRTRISKKKRELQKENSELLRENASLKGQLRYYQRVDEQRSK